MQKGFIPILIIVGLLALSGMVGGGYFYYQQQKIKSINSFEECAKAGYPVMQIYPPRCNTPDGRSFTKELSPEQQKRLDEKFNRLKAQQVQANKRRELLQKCGDLTRDDFGLNIGHYTVVDGPEWAPDCKHTALAIWQSGTSWLGEELEVDPNKVYATPDAVYVSSEPGIYLYENQSKKTTRIYQAEGVISFKGWKDAQTIIFENNQGIQYLDIYSLKVSN